VTSVPSFSSTGPAVELIAPGVSVLSTIPGNKYATYNGTSMASPHVAGVAALVWGAKPTSTNIEIRGVLSATAENLELPEEHQGKGLVRADSAVLAVTGDQPATHTITATAGTGGSITPSGEVKVNEGSNQTFAITTNTGYEIADVLVDTSSVGPVSSYIFENVRNDHTIEASFAPKTYTLTYTAGDYGTLSGVATQTVPYGGSGTEVGAVPDEGYVFDKWSDNSIMNPRIDANVTSDISVMAYFKVKQSDPPPSGFVTAEIDYSTSGGRLNDRHLQVMITVKNTEGMPVSAAAVSITLNRDGSNYATSSGTTGSNGSVTFSYNNAPSGTYTTKVTSVNATGLTWDGITPDNSFTK
jgi:subtilisin family serine protease